MKMTAPMMACLCLCLVAPGAGAQEKQTIRKLKNCGSEATNSFGSHEEFPAIDEGAGFVGFKTADTDANGTRQRFSLVNCETRSIVRIDADYKLTDSGKGLKGGTDLFGFVDSLRENKRLANESLFARYAEQNGFPVTKGVLPNPTSEEAMRSSCGCGLFYPELMRSWPRS